MMRRPQIYEFFFLNDKHYDDCGNIRLTTLLLVIERSLSLWNWNSSALKFFIRKSRICSIFLCQISRFFKRYKLNLFSLGVFFSLFQFVSFRLLVATFVSLRLNIVHKRRSRRVTKIVSTIFAKKIKHFIRCLYVFRKLHHESLFDPRSSQFTVKDMHTRARAHRLLDWISVSLWCCARTASNLMGAGGTIEKSIKSNTFMEYLLIVSFPSVVENWKPKSKAQDFLVAITVTVRICVFLWRWNMWTVERDRI